MFFLFHWLRPYGDQASIKLLNSWRQGWNWTELPVTWLPLPNDNLGFNQKKPLSPWLIQKLCWRTPRSAGARLFLFTSLSAQFMLLAPLQSTPLSYKMCVFKNGWRSLLQRRSPAWGARIRALLFLVLFEDVSRERPHHTLTHRHPHTHTHISRQ